MISFKNLFRSKYFINFNSRLLVQIFSQVLSLIILPVTSRALGPEKFGEIAFASAIYGYALLILQFGFNQHIIVSLSQGSDNKHILSEVISLKFYLSVIIFGSVLGGTFIFSDGLSSQAWVILIINMSLFSEAFNLGPYFFAKEKMFINATTQAIGTLLKSILVFMVVRNPRDVIWLGVFILLNNTVDKLMKLIFYKDREFPLNLMFPNIRMLKYFRLSSDFGFSYFVEKATRFFIPLLIGIVLTKSQLGLFNAANRLFNVGLFLFANLITTFMPLIYRVNNTDDRQKSLEVTNLLFFTFLILGIAGSLFTWFLSEPLIHILLGNEFLFSAVILKTWSFIIFLIPISMLIQNIIIGRKKTRAFFRINLLAGSFTVAGTLILVKIAEFNGAIYAQAAAFLLYFIFSFYYLFKEKLYSMDELTYILNPRSFVFNLSRTIKS